MAATLLAVVASGIFLVRLLPQPIRLYRTGLAAGVSPLAAINSVVITGAWLTYGLSTGIFAVWAVSVVALIPGVWMIVLLARRVSPTDALWASCLLGALLAAAAAGVLAGSLAAGVLVSSGPQVWRALRHDDLRGIAPATWWVAVGDAVSWGAYGFVVHDAALKGYAAVLLASAVTVLLRLQWVKTVKATTV